MSQVVPLIEGRELVPVSETIKNVYVHVPFCTHICPYCAFYKTKNLTRDMKPFLPALQNELEWARSVLPIVPETIFFGGGTPSALSIHQLNQWATFWPWQEVPEYTMEANPMTISEKKAQYLLELGFNRISLGVQAFDQGSLKVLGRTHSANDVVESVQILRRAGFANINIDLMFNLPGQTVEIWKDSLQQAVALEPDHLSLYQLTYEEDTDFFEKLRRGEMKEEPLGREMYARGIEYLGRHGYEHYEISNFARPGFEARHNQACWRGEDYLGLGPSACSTVGEWRWQTVSDISAYGQDPLQRKWEPLAPETRQQERVILGLRTREGIPRGWISGKDRFLEEMENQGLLLVRSQRIILTPEGRMIADSILEEIV